MSVKHLLEFQTLFILFLTKSYHYIINSYPDKEKSYILCNADKRHRNTAVSTLLRV